jgi:hypothetical protein
MTYLEVHTDETVDRSYVKPVYSWPIENLPPGSTEQDHQERNKIIDGIINVYFENMAFAFKNAKIYIVHKPKIESHETAELEPDAETVRDDQSQIYDSKTNGRSSGRNQTDGVQHLQPQQCQTKKGAVGKRLSALADDGRVRAKKKRA